MILGIIPFSNKFSSTSNLANQEKIQIEQRRRRKMGTRKRKINVYITTFLELLFKWEWLRGNYTQGCHCITARRVSATWARWESSIKELRYATTQRASFKLDFGLLLSPGTLPRARKSRLRRTHRKKQRKTYIRPFASIKHK